MKFFLPYSGSSCQDRICCLPACFQNGEPLLIFGSINTCNTGFLHAGGGIAQCSRIYAILVRSQFHVSVDRASVHTQNTFKQLTCRTATTAVGTQPTIVKSQALTGRCAIPNSNITLSLKKNDFVRTRNSFFFKNLKQVQNNANLGMNKVIVNTGQIKKSFFVIQYSVVTK